MIQSLADEDDPTLFGLPANVTFAWAQIETRNTLLQLRNVHVDERASNQFNRQLWSDALSPVLNLWKKLNQARF